MATFNGNNNKNLYNGGAADDIIRGNGGDDKLFGGDGQDYIDGGNDNDSLDGGNGNDTLLGGSGNDTLIGGAGNDSMDGGTGVDLADFSSSTATMWVNLTTGTATGQGTDTLLNIENVNGSSLADFITGSAANNQLRGNDGNDVLTATGGVDVLDGGNGQDSVSFTGTGAVVANLTTGMYTISANDNGTLISIEHITGSAGADSLTGNSVRNVLDGMGGNDTIIGGGGDDQIWGGAGSDRLIADGGNDNLVGNYSYTQGYGDSASDIFEIRTTAGNVNVGDFKMGVDKLDLTAFGFDANGVSPYWTGSAVQSGTNTLLTLSGQNAEQVTICMQGMIEGYKLGLNDMIGGSASLIAPPPSYPINGGNGVADVFLILPQNGNVVIDHFENGLDKMDLRQMDMNNYWGGFLANAPGSTDAILNFQGMGGEAFTVTLTGMPYWNIDASDYILA